MKKERLRRTVVGLMKSVRSGSFFYSYASSGAAIRKNQFRRKFQLSLRQCVRHGFSIEECFGMIWNETLEEIGLPEAEEAELYQELIDWAREWITRGAVPQLGCGELEGSHSQALNGCGLQTPYWLSGRA